MNASKEIHNIYGNETGNGDFTIISFAIKAIMTKYPSIFTKIRSFGNTIAFT